MKIVLLLCFSFAFLFLKGQKLNKQTKIILKSIVGSFSNQVQVQNLPDTVFKKFTPSKPWNQLLFATHLKVIAPALGNNVVYLCWRKDSINGAIERQRIWVFENTLYGNTVMRFYAFANDSIAKAMDTNNNLLTTINKKQLVSYSDSCVMNFTKNNNDFIGFLNPDACQIIAQKSGRKMGLLAKVVLNKNGFDYNEAGFLENSTKAFEVPGGSSYMFRKVK